jgi:uncharacterized protein
MDTRISLITLGVDDLARATAFYAALGWVGQEVEGTVFIQAGGLALVLWDRGLLAADAGLVDEGRRGFSGITLAQNVRTTAEVDQVLATAAAAGATITTPAHETFYGGYAGYFVDLDGHAWEVAHNPGFTLEADGSLTLPDFD